MSKRDTLLVRVDREVWSKCKEILPKESGPSISRMLYRTSLLNIENRLDQVFGKRKKD